MKLSEAVVKLRVKGDEKALALFKIKRGLERQKRKWTNKQQIIFDSIWDSTIEPAKQKLGAKQYWAISDIHGCYDTLRALLEKIKFGPDTVVYLLGDYIDRGKNSKLVLDWIIRSKKNVVPLCGNHEQMVINCLDDPELEKYWLKNLGGRATLKSFGVSSVFDIPKAYINFLRKLKPVIRVKDYVLVHGGVDFSRIRPFKNDPKQIDKLLWNRDATEHSDIKMIVGHTPQGLRDIVKSTNTNKVRIDGNCARNGYLVAYSLSNNKIVYQKNVETKK
jgi:serine/threonine protein phosphatase 1